MQDSRTIGIFVENGATTDYAVEVEHPDDDGDVFIRVWRRGKDVMGLYVSTSCARAIARALMEAAG